MRISLFSSAHSNDGRAVEWAWADFVKDLLAGHTAVPMAPGPATETPRETKDREQATKTNQPAFSPAVYRGTRSNDNVESISLAVTDVDHITVEAFSAILAHIQSQGLEALVYSGWSHGITPGEVSARIIVPLAQPIPANLWPRTWPQVVQALGNVADAACKDPSRLYFLPACPSYRKDIAFIAHLPGHHLEIQNLPLSEASLDIVRKSLGERKVERDEIVKHQKAIAKGLPEVANALKRMLNGDAWEEQEGKRDLVLFKVASNLAGKFPDTDPTSFLPFFSASFSQFSYPEREKDKFVDKFIRGVNKGITDEDTKSLGSLSSRQTRISQAYRGERSTPYTAEEQALCAPQGWIIQYRASWYFYVVGKGYVGPFGRDDATPAAHTYLAPTALRLTEVTLSGEPIDRDIKSLTMEYGMVASNLVLDMSATVAIYDPQTATITEAPCPPRKIVAKYSLAVDSWLHMLAGNKYEKLATWLAYAKDLTLPCSALFLEGDPGAGKSLLATGLSYLYTTNGPTSLEQVMGSFNEILAKCPIVFADETAPTDFKGKARTAELREIIQATTRHFTRKNLPAGTLKGACRIVIAANSTKIFEGEDTLTQADIDAITSRILHIRVGPKAKRFLVEQQWQQGQGREEEIAAHIQWLIENAFKTVNPGRFIVSDASDLVRLIATSTTLGSAVAHWLTAALLNRCGKLRIGMPDSAGHLLRVIGGQIYVSPRTLIECWGMYETNVAKHMATSKRVVSGLSAFSSGPTEVGGHVFYPIRTADLVSWAQSNGHAMAEEIHLALKALDDNNPKLEILAGLPAIH